jgi:hypothetical protein
MRRRGVLIPALVAIAALSVAMAVGPAAGASGGHAVAAKKKCKKKKSKSSAESAKKKKCKKKKKQAAVAPVVRATLNWSNGGSNDVDMDLFVFGASGHAGNGSDTISSSTLSPDVTGPSGSETFTDLAFNQKRDLSFGVCYMVGGSVHTDYTITYVTADGVTHTETRADDGNPPSLGSSAHVNYPGGISIPDNYCPGTNLVP